MNHQYVVGLRQSLLCLHDKMEDICLVWEKYDIICFGDIYPGPVARVQWHGCSGCCCMLAKEQVLLYQVNRLIIT